MLSFVEKYGGGDHSQNGEAGIITECIKRIGYGTGIAVEFGAPTKSYCSNIFHLHDTHHLVYFDIDPQQEGIFKCNIVPENVNELLPACDVLSIDIDGNDYEVWKAYNGTPDIVIIEINSSLPPTKAHFSLERGASYITMLLLGLDKGYFLLCHTGNMVFVRNEHRSLFPEVIGDGLENWEDYFNKSWL